MTLDLETWINENRLAWEKEISKAEGRLEVLNELIEILKVAHENENLDSVGSRNKDTNLKVSEVDIRSPGAQFSNPGKYSDGTGDTEDPEGPIIVGGKISPRFNI